MSGSPSSCLWWRLGLFDLSSICCDTPPPKLYSNRCSFYREVFGFEDVEYDDSCRSGWSTAGNCCQCPPDFRRNGRNGPMRKPQLQRLKPFGRFLVCLATRACTRSRVKHAPVACPRHPLHPGFGYDTYIYVQCGQNAPSARELPTYRDERSSLIALFAFIGVQC